MAGIVRAEINPQTLIEARKLAGYPDTKSVYQNLANANAEEKKLIAFETGERKPTSKQLKDIAEKYALSTGLLYLSPESLVEQLPKIDDIHDFRMGGDRKNSPQLIRLLREVLTRQERLNDILEDDDIPDLKWIGSGKNLSIENSAAKLRHLIWGEIRHQVSADWIKRTEERLGVTFCSRGLHARAIDQQIAGLRFIMIVFLLLC